LALDLWPWLNNLQCVFTFAKSRNKDLSYLYGNRYGPIYPMVISLLKNEATETHNGYR
jgi:hypothetical protein